MQRRRNGVQGARVQQTILTVGSHQSSNWVSRYYLKLGPLGVLEIPGAINDTDRGRLKRASVAPFMVTGRGLRGCEITMQGKLLSSALPLAVATIATGTTHPSHTKRNRLDSGHSSGVHWQVEKAEMSRGKATAVLEGSLAGRRCWRWARRRASESESELESHWGSFPSPADLTNGAESEIRD